MLRVKQMGLSIDDLEQLDEGFVLDMLVESGNDNASGEYQQMATQEDFDRF